MADLKELRRLAEAAKMVTCIIDRRGDMGAFKQVCTPSAIIELLDEIEQLKCCGNCKHQTYDGMDYGCELVLKNYHRNKCDKWQAVK